MGYSPWGRKELDTTERLTLSHHAKREKKKQTGRTKFIKNLRVHLAM